MGNHHTQDESFPYQDWEPVDSSYKEINSWQNRTNPQLHLQQVTLCTDLRKDYNQIRDLYFKRKNHPRWVAAQYLNQLESDSFCTNSYVADIFLEKIPIRLFDLINVTFPNVLHLYHQALLGYYQFSRKVGNFIVESQYMGVNQKGVLKVWAGATFSSISVSIGKNSQQDMVHSVIQCIQKSINKASMPKHNPSIRNFIYRSADRINFSYAITQFQTYVRMMNAGQIPDRLTSLNQNSGLRISFKDFLPSDRNHWTQNKQSMIKSQKSFEHYLPLGQSQGLSSQGYSNRIHSSSQQQITTFRKVQSIAQQSNYSDKENKSNQISYKKPIKSQSHHQSNIYENNTIPINYNNNQYSGQQTTTENTSLAQNYQQIIEHRFHHPNINQNSYFSRQHQQNYFRRPPNITQHQQQNSNNIYCYRSNTTSTQTATNNSSPQIQPSRNKQHIDSIPVTQHKDTRRPHYTPQILQSPKNYQTSKSIIISTYSNNKASNTNFINKYQQKISRPEQNQQITSYTVINQDQPSQIRGIPKNQLQGKLIALVNIQNSVSNNLSHLQSIEQVNTERLSTNQEDSQQSSVPSNRNIRKIAYAHTPNNSYSSNFNKSDKTFKQNRSKNAQNISIPFPTIYNHNTNRNCQIINKDDGKSSEQFMAKMKNLSLNLNTTQQRPTEVDPTRKYVSFTDSKQNIVQDQYMKPTVPQANLYYEQSNFTGKGAIQFLNHK